MIDELIGSIISLKNINHFSAVEIRTAIIVIKRDQTLVPSEVRRFVYEELLKLVNKGWLRKLTSKKKGVTRYTKTELFDNSLFDSSHLQHIEAKESLPTLNADLHPRLHNYKTELLEGLGALEECISLRDEYPHLHASLKNKYNNLREHNHMLMGKIRTLEGLLTSNRDTN